MSTHHNMVAAAKSIVGYLGNREDDVILSVLPFRSTTVSIRF